ncbi:hypothetical protein ACIRPJ_33270 [Streptomyces asoensis]|uniref:hypothetical protein n=1 Tax=Streptomyces asoensis TaxID=249586 RepID=UPI001675892A|nr:hypothetical protein [Streptomyces asoensis]GGQ97455.1 hypothetical protein GCM10010496_72990 [Streptomyces asoensis]
MANLVWHTKLRIHLDLTLEDLGHEEHEGLWDMVYGMDRMYSARAVPVAERDLQCGGVCQEAGVVAPMYLRMRNGRREAVHERREDEDRHSVPVSDEHKAYQERILRAAEVAGFRGDSEVRTRVGRSWIQTDTLIEGVNGLRVGWEVQLSTAGTDGPRSVRARAAKAEKNGITPAWHTDRSDYAHRHDTHWTRSNNLPAHVIAKIGDLRVVSGFRKLDFWRCDIHADHPCPHGVRRCGKYHATPVPKDILFDDLVRETAAGTIVPVQFRTPNKTHRFWATHADHNRYKDLLDDDGRLPASSEDVPTPSRASHNRPTCRPELTATSSEAATPKASQTSPATTAGLLAAQPTAPALEAIAPQAAEETAPPDLEPPADVAPASWEALVERQRVANAARDALHQLSDHEERKRQRHLWFEAAHAAQTAVTRYALSRGLNRFEVEQTVRGVAREEPGAGASDGQRHAQG